MICPGIRRLTAAERSERDERHATRYERIESELKESQRAEYEREFGPTYKERHPYVLDGEALHERVLQRMRAEEVGIED
jgi:hypothetical protein